MCGSGRSGPQALRRWAMPGRQTRCRHALVAVCGVGFVIVPMNGWSQVATTLNGPPVQVTPYVGEPGVPVIVINPGTPNPLPSSGGAGGGGGGGGGPEDGGTGGDTNVLTTMMGTAWGITAITNSEAVGINPTALAATCVLESGCGANLGSGGAQGVFQMYPAAYQEGLQTALTANPALASQVVSGAAGMNDPTTEAIAASGYLMLASQSLASNGISSPTVLDVRSYYEFGPTYGPEVASAQGNMLLSSILPRRFLSSNGIASAETVAQWQASISAQIGNAANENVQL